MPLPSLKLIGAAVVLATLIGSHLCAYWHGRGAEKAIQQVAIAEAQAKARKTEDDAAHRITEAEREYQAKIADSEARYRDAIARIGPVRVQNCPSDRRVPETAIAASVNPSAASGDGFPATPGDDPRDIGPDLVELVRVADQQTDRLIACQRYASEVERFRAALP